MPLRLDRLGIGVYWGKPFSQCRVSSIGCGPVHRVHLVSQGVDFRVDEETGVAVSSTAPNDVRRGIAIPFRDFVNDTLAIRGFR